MQILSILALSSLLPPVRYFSMAPTDYSNLELYSTLHRAAGASFGSQNFYSSLHSDTQKLRARSLSRLRGMLRRDVTVLTLHHAKEHLQESHSFSVSRKGLANISKKRKQSTLEKLCTSLSRETVEQQSAWNSCSQKFTLPQTLIHISTISGTARNQFCIKH